ncbi:putative pyrroloquinoline-quinone binding quinoprotein [Krasilnikovia cinnamomea]|uniref:Putative pyrroloquinoline-quinone binding quinoprotein n=1 Tax=Krasilnikovia cinnamomea TaxID=349313 RepID=A0A4Q7ZI85_9ACTN|nr:PQQ-binding-like beta-propeller repeat protein [Krasilnikovia cinnamomea]RZU50557.1 putative pyrroloquinoline-quinone binding quinoprotein [Krasilnikovia cinnamomea]
MFWVVAAASAVVLGVAATLAVVFWPKYPALAFQPLADPSRVAPAVPITSRFAAATVRGDRAYFASVSDDGTLGVVAADTGTGERLWGNPAAGDADDWQQLVALPDAVVAVSAEDDDRRRMVLLDPGSGKPLWDRVIGDDDTLLYAEDTVVLVDREEDRLLGLDVRGQGRVRWELKDPGSLSGSRTTTVLAATTPEDLAAPTSAKGAPFAEPLDDDRRIVQIGADRSARVIDARTGAVLVPPRQSVADPDDPVVAHDGTLVVAESDNARRIVAYDLAKLGEPRVLYTAPDDNTRFEHLTPCGTDRVCAVQTTSSDAKTAQVVAVDVAEGGRRWAWPLPDTNNLVPVGDSLLAAQNTTPAKVSLLGADGTVRWTRDGVAARLDGGNLLRFAKPLSTYTDDPSVAGEHLGDDAVELGPLSGVRPATCAWNTAVLACVADEDFVLRRFAG